MTIHRSRATGAVIRFDSRRRALLAGAAALALACATGMANAQSIKEETPVTLKEQTGLAVTIYSNFAMIRDDRRVTVKGGRNYLSFIDVSGQLRPETALLSNGPGATLSLVEQNFNYDLITPRKLLEKSVGKEVGVLIVDPKTREQTLKRATVLSTSGGVVLQIGDRIYTGLPGRLVFDKLPEDLRARPTLVVTLDSDKAATVPVSLTYLSAGLSWKADYVLNLSEKEDSFDLAGWVTLNNRSGTTYKNAQLQLVAGEVNLARYPTGQMSLSPAPRVAREADRVRRTSVSDYYLYTVKEPTTIAHNQQKQIALMKASGVKVTKEYRYSGQSYYFRARRSSAQRVKASVYLHFENDKASNLGLPLPSGIVRVYKKDASGKALFLGEDRMGHVAEGEDVRLRLGNAFDVSVEKVQTDYRRSGLARRSYETAYTLTLKNAKKEPVTVIVTEPVPGDWQMIAESNPHKKISSGQAEWRIRVPAKGSTQLTYRVMVTY